MCPRAHILRSIVVPHDIVHLHVSRRGRLEQRSVRRRPTSRRDDAGYLTYLATSRVNLSSAATIAKAKKEGGRKHASPKSSAKILHRRPFLKLVRFMSLGQRRRPLRASSWKLTRWDSPMFLRICHPRVSKAYEKGNTDSLHSRGLLTLGPCCT